MSFLPRSFSARLFVAGAAALLCAALFASCAAKGNELSRTVTGSTSADVPSTFEVPGATSSPDGALVDGYVGLSEGDATSKAQADGFTVRVGERDGESFGMTADFVFARVTFSVTDGVVVSAKIG